MVVVIKYLAHAGFEIKANERVVYVDLEKYGEASDKADLVLVTHSHTDHCDPDKIKAIGKVDTVIIAPEDCASKIGGKVKTLMAGQQASVGGIGIKAVEAYNTKRFRSPGVPFHPKGFGVGYLITAEGKTIYHAGDTDFIPEMLQLGKVDVALIPSGDTYTVDNSEAAEAVIAINPRIAVPMHRWKTDPGEFRRTVEDRSRVKVAILREGEELRVNEI